MRLAAALASVCICGSAAAQSALPFDALPFEIGGPYALTDQYGQSRTEKSPDGAAQLLFFGYVNCQNICSAALPLMADVTDALAAEGIDITPVMITVAPERDRVDTMAEPLALLHPDFIGLTGAQSDLQAAYDAFSVEVEPIFEDIVYGWIYSHGSFVHLLDADGETLTLLPPILSADQTTDIVRSYLAPDGA